jgi:5'-nucleotidase
MHGDFLPELNAATGELTGGLALLSGYINKVRTEEENVLYVIPGDMCQGSLIDSEYRGVSTMEIMNYLAPDVVTLGNHEFDYGLPHLLFLEKIANFPIVNANLYIRHFHKRLMQPYCVIQKAGLDLLFTGVITERVIDTIKMDDLISTFISLEEASAEIGKICNAFRNDDIDLTIVLSHIGFESDLQLAQMLNPEWGVDLIIGGHSHTFLDQPRRINGIYVSQAGVGTDQIGRYDILVDDDTNSIVDMRWQLVPITDRLVEPDKQLEEFVHSFRDRVDYKYNTVLCKFSQKLTHPKRETETTLGNLFADIIAEHSRADVALVSSGSIRSREMGPVVTVANLTTCFPYDDAITRFTLRGNTLRGIFAHIMRPENRNHDGECYQVNASVRAVYEDSTRALRSLRVKGRAVRDEGLYTVALQGYHIKNSEPNLSVTNQELLEAGRSRVVTTSARDVIQEYLSSHRALTRKLEGRLTYR